MTIAASLFANADAWLHSRIERAPGDFIVVSERLASVGFGRKHNQPAPRSQQNDGEAGAGEKSIHNGGDK